MGDIKPMYVDGEPVCGGEDCPKFKCGSIVSEFGWCDGRCSDKGQDPCIPAMKARIEELETELNSRTEHLCGSNDLVKCCRCGQTRAVKNTFKLDISGDKWMCWLCAGKHYRGMDMLIAQEQARVKELEAENRRLRRRCADAIWEGAIVISDFAGCDIKTAVRDLAANLRDKDNTPTPGEEDASQ